MDYLTLLRIIKVITAVPLITVSVFSTTIAIKELIILKGNYRKYSIFLISLSIGTGAVGIMNGLRSLGLVSDIPGVHFVFRWFTVVTNIVLTGIMMLISKLMLSAKK